MLLPKVDVPSCSWCEILFSLLHFALSGFSGKVPSEPWAGSLLPSVALQGCQGSGMVISPLPWGSAGSECAGEGSESLKLRTWQTLTFPGVHHSFGSFPGFQAPFPVFPV